jgi:hypothetical protein
MPEIELKNVEDLKKLEGWLITKAEFLNGVATLELTLSHIAADKKLLFSITGGVQSQFAPEGNCIIMKTIPVLVMRSKDAEEIKNEQT